jgi:hypothetical protein
MVPTYSLLYTILMRLARQNPVLISSLVFLQLSVPLPPRTQSPLPLGE